MRFGIYWAVFARSVLCSWTKILFAICSSPTNLLCKIKKYQIFPLISVPVGETLLGGDVLCRPMTASCCPMMELSPRYLAIAGKGAHGAGEFNNLLFPLWVQAKLVQRTGCAWSARLCVHLGFHFHRGFVFIFFRSTNNESFLLVSWWKHDQWEVWDSMAKQRRFSSATNYSDIQVRKLMLKRARIEAASFV